MKKNTRCFLARSNSVSQEGFPLVQNHCILSLSQIKLSFTLAVTVIYDASLLQSEWVYFLTRKYWHSHRENALIITLPPCHLIKAKAGSISHFLVWETRWSAPALEHPGIISHRHCLPWEALSAGRGSWSCPVREWYLTSSAREALNLIKIS